jgi:hypothetical protein
MPEVEVAFCFLHFFLPILPSHKVSSSVS